MEVKDFLYKAIRWYLSGDKNKKDAALELFPEDVIKTELINFKNEEFKEKNELRKQELQEKLERCKKLFPIGTMVWNDDGCDRCPNIIISEPYIEECEDKLPYKILYDDVIIEKTTIVAKTLRIFRNKPLTNSSNSIIGLERILYNIDSDIRDTTIYRNPFINLKEFIKNENVNKQKALERINKDIFLYQNKVDMLKKDLEELNAYEPSELTEELINKLTTAAIKQIENN